MQANWRENRQDLVFPSPTTRVHMTFRAKIFRPESPSAPRGAGGGVGSPDGLRAKSGRKRGTGGATGPNFAVRMEKTSLGGLVGGRVEMLLVRGLVDLRFFPPLEPLAIW